MSFAEKIVFTPSELFSFSFRRKSFSFDWSSFRVLFGRLILCSCPFREKGKNSKSFQVKIKGCIFPYFSFLLYKRAKPSRSFEKMRKKWKKEGNG